MAQTVRTILFTANTAESPELRRILTSMPFLRIVAELDEPSLLPQAVSQFPCDLLIADLDPGAPVVIECLSQLREIKPDLNIFALSSQTEGDVVLRAMKAGVKEFLVKPLNVEELEQSVTRIAGEQTDTKNPGKLISILGSAGGVGGTTIATNLAVELADLVGGSEKVALVDLDFRFGHIATLLDIQGQYTVADLCATHEELEPEMILQALIKHETGLYVLRRPHSFAQAEMITAAHCATVLTGLQEMCDYVVVDGPTRHDPGARSVLDAADHVLMILQLLVTSVRNTDRMIQELTAQGFNPDRISLIFNRLGRTSGHLEVAQVETILDRKMFASVSDDWKTISASINIGQPLKLYDDRSKVREEIRSIAMMIHCPETAADPSKKGGILGKLFSRSGSERGGDTEGRLPETASPAAQG